MNKYSISVVWSEEDEAYIALCPEFPGLSGIGDTVEEAIGELQVALKLAIETYQAEGWALPEPYKQTEHSGKLHLRMPKSLHSRLAQQAEIEGVSLNSLVVTLLSEASGLITGVSRVEQAVTQMMRTWNTSVTQTVAAIVWSHGAAPGAKLVRLSHNDRRRYPTEAPSASSAYVTLTSNSPPSHRRQA